MPSGIPETRTQYDEEYEELLQPIRKKLRNEKPRLFDWLKVMKFFTDNFSGDPKFISTTTSTTNTLNQVLGIKKDPEQYDEVAIWWGITCLNKTMANLTSEDSAYPLRTLYFTVEPYMPKSLQGIASPRTEVIKTDMKDTYDPRIFEKLKEFNSWLKFTRNRCEIYFARQFHQRGTRANEVILSRLFKDNWGDKGALGSPLEKSVESFKLEIADV